MPKESFNPMTFGGKEGFSNLGQAKKSSILIPDQSFKDYNMGNLATNEKNSHSVYSSNNRNPSTISISAVAVEQQN